MSANGSAPRRSYPVRENPYRQKRAGTFLLILVFAMGTWMPSLLWWAVAVVLGVSAFVYLVKSLAFDYDQEQVRKTAERQAGEKVAGR